MKSTLVIKDICQSGGDNVSDGGGQTGWKRPIPDSLWVRDLDTGERLYPALGGGAEPKTLTIGHLIAASIASTAATAIVGMVTAPKPPTPPSFDIPSDAELAAKESRAERQERLRRQRAVTSQSTMLTSTLGMPIPENKVAKPTLGGIA